MVAILLSERNTHNLISELDTMVDEMRKAGAYDLQVYRTVQDFRTNLHSLLREEPEKRDGIALVRMNNDLV